VEITHSLQDLLDLGLTLLFHGLIALALHFLKVLIAYLLASNLVVLAASIGVKDLVDLGASLVLQVLLLIVFSDLPGSEDCIDLGSHKGFEAHVFFVLDLHSI
jgi:hypothetical protein